MRRRKAARSSADACRAGRSQRKARPYLTPIEVYALTHREHVLQSEIEWHETFQRSLPSIDLSIVANLEPQDTNA